MLPDRVLLVDDEAEFVETLAERLHARGLEVEVALTGMEGIAKAQATRFDLVVLDFAMPGMDGVATLRALRAASPDLQVILLTGQPTIKAAVEATRLGAVEFLEKPMDIATLMERIHDARVRRVAQADERVRQVVGDTAKLKASS